VLTAWQANELSDYAHIWRATDPSEVEHHDAVLLVRHPHRRVHLIGVGELGEHLRPLLRGGVEGWRLHELPVTQTPLNDAEPLLGPRVYAILARFGFATVEEIAAVPDLGLLDIRHFGPKTRLDIRTTRHATGAAGRRGGARPGPRTSTRRTRMRCSGVRGHPSRMLDHRPSRRVGGLLGRW